MSNQENNQEVKRKGVYIFREAKIPQPVEVVDKKGWVKWGSDNLYPQFLWKLYYESSIHGGIINSKVTFITSGGLEYEGGNPQEFERVMKNGLNSYSLTDIYNSVARDNEVCNSFLYYFKKSADGFWYLKPMDVELIRKSEDEDVFYYSEDWSASAQTKEKTNYREIVSLNNIDENSLECILYVTNRAKQYKLSDKGKNKLTENCYPIPNYSGAISSIMADEEMNFFHYSEVVNGFKGGTLVSLNDGIPDSIQEENKIIKELKGESSKRETQGGLSVVFTDGKEREPSVLQLNGNNLDSRYLLTQEHLRDSIMVAHSVITPALFGVKTPGQLGNTQELLTGYLIFVENYVRQRQSLLLDSLNYALKELNGFTGEIVASEYIPSYLGGDKESDKSTPEGEDIENVAGTAMNGAQISSLVGIVEAVNLNTLTPEAAVQVISVAFPSISNEQAKKIVGMGSAFVAMFGKKDKEPTTEQILSLFEGCGTDRDKYDFLDSREMQTFEGVELNEKQYINQYVKEKFVDVLTPDQNLILKMFDDGESFQAIKTATELSARELTKEIISLKSKGFLNTPDQSKIEITNRGKDAIKSGQQFSVVYTYELRPDAPELVKGGKSRPFCSTLIGFNRVYSRLEIDTISANVNRNVWLFRGGWYHDPKADKNQPSCRHYWKQNIVILNN